MPLVDSVRPPYITFNNSNGERDVQGYRRCRYRCGSDLPHYSEGTEDGAEPYQERVVGCH